jgi:hypothetical protein
VLTRVVEQALGHKLYDAYRVKKSVAMEEIEVANMHVKVRPTNNKIILIIITN